MDKRKVICPHCNEEMEAPANRESIICMFCGKTIFLTSNDQEKIEDVANSYVYLEEHLEEMLEPVERYMKGFDRYNYENLYKEFKTKNIVNLKQIINVCETGGQDGFEKICSLIFKNTDKMLDGVKGRGNRENLHMSFNLFMVAYFLPTLMENPSPKVNSFTSYFCEQWSKHYKNSNIQPATYENIQAGFKRKLCYITTAVCQSLNKPLDCVELQMLKAYRDDYLLHRANGDTLVNDYYDIAPTILKRIDRLPDASAIYKELYEKYISKCIEHIQNEDMEACRDLYIEMVNGLKESFFVTNKR